MALSIIEYCDTKQPNKKLALKVDYCIKRILSEKAKSTFNPNLEPKYGMFYNGWTNYTLKKYLESNLFQYSTIPDRVKAANKNIEKRIISAQLDSLRLLDTYSEASWPADNMIGVLSLDNDSIATSWLSKILDTTEHPSDLIHHTGSDTKKIRGSSSALITFCLTEMNYDKVDLYNQTFRELFIDEYLGVQLVKENEDGSGDWDVDSGPVVFGYGASATIMNIKTQASLHHKKSKRTWALMNTISLPVNVFGKKYYLFKKEPMFDLFMLWASVEFIQ